MPNKERKEEVIVTFKVKVVVRDDTTVKDLLTNQTEFIAEPRSINGCVLDMKLKSIT